jgi:outer membrane lipoprotein-sorting protein
MVPIYTRLAKIEGLEMKAPNSNIQAPTKLRYPSSQSGIQFRAARSRCLVFLWSLVLGAWSFSVHAVDTNAVISKWIAAQANIHTFSADVVQTRTFKSLTQPLTAYGHVWFEAPNRFRWELTNPVPSIAVRGSEEMLVIYPKIKRAERYPLTGEKAGQWRDVMKLLDAGFPRSEADVQSQYNILSQQVNGEVCELTLQPKSTAARKLMPQIKIGFSTKDSSLTSTELQMVDGSIMRNDFKNTELNPKIDPSLFAPKLDGDYKISEPFKP